MDTNGVPGPLETREEYVPPTVVAVAAVVVVAVDGVIVLPTPMPMPTLTAPPGIIIGLVANVVGATVVVVAAEEEEEDDDEAEIEGAE